jgi:hypothetical protein
MRCKPVTTVLTSALFANDIFLKTRFLHRNRLEIFPMKLSSTGILQSTVVPMADTHSEKIAYQPLHPSVVPELEKAYVEYHNGNFQFLEPVTEWSSNLRTAPSRFASTSSGPVKVGDVRDVNVGHFQARIYTPEGVPPAAGWPVLLGNHGGKVFPFVASECIVKAESVDTSTGGWAQGDLRSDEHIWTQICRGLSLGPVSSPWC